jgi:hypothetical protein
MPTTDSHRFTPDPEPYEGSQPTEQEVLARAFVPFDPYERALILRREHRHVPIQAEILAVLPTYEKRREAAAAVLAKDPNATWQAPWPAKSRSRIAAPPTEDETAALAASLRIAVKRWDELNKAGGTAYDREALRAAFVAAVWYGSKADEIAAWSDWVTTIASAAAREAEMTDLNAQLAIRNPTSARAPVPPQVPGTTFAALGGAVRAEMPDYAKELRDAMHRLPPVAPAGKAGKAGKT